MFLNREGVIDSVKYDLKQLVSKVGLYFRQWFFLGFEVRPLYTLPMPNDPIEREYFWRLGALL
jgi:hypothetical protein